VFLFTQDINLIFMVLKLSMSIKSNQPKLEFNLLGAHTDIEVSGVIITKSNIRLLSTQKTRSKITEVYNSQQYQF
jgi:hypothetical protein